MSKVNPVEIILLNSSLNIRSLQGPYKVVTYTYIYPERAPARFATANSALVFEKTKRNGKMQVRQHNRQHCCKTVGHTYHILSACLYVSVMGADNNKRQTTRQKQSSYNNVLVPSHRWPATPTLGRYGQFSVNNQTWVPALHFVN